MCVSRAKRQDEKRHQENKLSHHYFTAFYLKNTMAYCLNSLYCSVSFFVIEGANSQSARASWGVAAWKAKCSILCLRLVLLQVLGKTREVKLLRQIKAHSLQFNLFEYPFKWKYPPFLQVWSLKPAKWSRKKLCPVHIPAWWTFLCCSVVTGPLCTAREKL